MFTNLRLSIFIYYFTTVVGALLLSYYFFVELEVSKLFILSIIALSFVTLSALFISKLSVDPLEEYVKNLQNLSKETLHELNLPISTIRTNLGMLSKNIEDEKNSKRLKRIESACEMLQERYNELDYLIKMQSHSDVREQFFVDDLVKNRVEFFSTIYPQVEFILSLQSLEVFNDKIGFTKVIDNIVDNGVKYSKNSKKIVIKIEQKSLLIQDYGIGMDEVELLAIFDNYYQTNTTVQGFGIGLSMVKRFCDANGVELIFHSKKGVGTKVELKFKK